jgi:TolB-like protein/Tfp pilus assembly protein PilF
MSDSDSGPAARPLRQREARADEVAAQLERILASREFAQSDRLQNFLRFVVEETIAGRADVLKEYTVAVEVFERDESFDPQTSSIVRVEASRLRGKLEQYNAIDGRNDPVHIALPPGGYVPTFSITSREIGPSEKQPNARPSSRARRFGSRWAVGLVGVLILVIGASTLLFLYPSSGTDQSPEASKPGQIYSVAVLPLRNLSGDAGQDYFSDGMTDALISILAKKGQVSVISMTSVMGYKNVNRPIADIAGELNVSHVIEGSVLRIDDRVRITAQLIEAETDLHIWAESYTRDVVDVLAMQDEIVLNIVSSLSEQVVPTDGVVPKSATIDPAAYEAYLKGRFFKNRLTVEGFTKGIAYFKQAIEKAPEFAPAYSGMAVCYCLLGGHGFEIVKPSEGMPVAKKAVMEALRLDDSLAEPQAFLGIIRLKYEWDWPGAEEAFKRSIELNPSYAQAHIFYSFFLEARGRQKEAIREAEEARVYDPLSLAANINLGWQYFQAGRPEKAKQTFERTAELNANFWGVHWGLGHYYRRKGNLAEAIAAFQNAIAAGGGHALPISALGYTYAIAGQPEAAQEMLDKLSALAEQTYVSPFNMAVIHAGLGDKDEAFAWLEKAYAQRSRSLAWLNVTEELDGIRADPRYELLARRIGLSN